MSAQTVASSQTRSAGVVVIGGGVNGLVCAATLATAGKSVLLLERRDRLGGVAAREEFHPAYTVPGLLHDTSRLRPVVIRELELAKYDLRLTGSRPPLFVPQLEGRGLLLHDDPEVAADELSAIGSSDVEGWTGFRRFIGRTRRFVEVMMDSEPPELTQDPSASVAIRLGLGLRRLGRADMSDILRIPTQPVADWMGEWFQSPLLSAAVCFPGIMASYAAPRSPGTTTPLLLAECMRGVATVGGPAAIVDALEQACLRRGVTIRKGAEVSGITVEGERATGVVLANGEEISAEVVVSGLDPKRTFLSLIDPSLVDSDLALAIERVRMRGTTAKVHLALSGPLELACRPGETFERIRIGEHPDDLERAFDAIKYGGMSERPHLAIRVPSLSVRGLAPEGHHVVSILVHYAPYHLRGGWGDPERALLQERVLDQLARYAPTVRDRIVASEVLTPVDLEDRYGLTEGHVHHGEPALDQLASLRPVPQCAGHRTPIDGLFLCGMGTHPGGGIHGGSGRLAARAVLG